MKNLKNRIKAAWSVLINRKHIVVTCDDFQADYIEINATWNCTPPELYATLLNMQVNAKHIYEMEETLNEAKSYLR